MSNQRDTLLTDHIRRELRNHVEPQRAGKAKGDLIGFSKPKLLTALFHLTSFKGVEIAELCDVPLNTFRVWRTEDPYKKAIDAYIRQFGQLSADRLVEASNEFYERAGRSGRFRGQDWQGPGLFELLYPLAADIVLLSDRAMEAIFSFAKEAARQQKADGRPEQAQAAFFAALQVLFLARRGYLIPNDQTGSLDMDKKSGKWKPIGDNATALDWAEAFQRPWTAPRHLVRAAMARFQKKLHHVIH